MAWVKMLSDTYETYKDKIGLIEDNQPILLPIAHSTVNAQIEVTLTPQAEIYDCREIPDDEGKVTVIPVTEDSASRGNGNNPHALMDKLCYVAGDFSELTGENKQEYFDLYLENLKNWIDSAYSDETIQVIFQYIAKRNLIHDCVEYGVLELDENGRFKDETKKLQGLGQTGAVVRFRIIGLSPDRNGELWKSNELFNKYSQYYLAGKTDQEICYVTGEITSCSDKHPSKIRHSGDKAKLISGNDNSGFTYRGRFVSKEDAVMVGYETSQKAHNALRWLIQKYGFSEDNSTFVSWVVNKPIELPKIEKNSIEAYQSLDVFQDLFQSYENTDQRTDFPIKFRSAIMGYTSKFNIPDKVVMMSVNAATTGRLSITYYNEFGAIQYLDAVRQWHENCSWPRYKKLLPSDEKASLLEFAPSPKEIAKAAYGTDRGKGYLEADNKLIQASIDRILPCIVQPGKAFPEDIIRAVVHKVARPEAVKSESLWYNQILCVACSLIKYKNIQKKGVEYMDQWKEKLDTDRNMLFGRLLAVYDLMESRAMYEKAKKNEGRMTNAKKYWNAYSRRPAKTYQTLKESLVPYLNKLNGYELKLFEAEEMDIITKLINDEFNNKPLNEDYIPAYYFQMKKMNDYFAQKPVVIEGGDE